MNESDLIEVTTWTKGGGTTFTGDIPQSWTQGRTAFGGLIVSALIRAMKNELQPERRLRTLVATFIAPVSPGPIEARLELLRVGKSLTLFQGRTEQDGQPRVIIEAGFGAPRKSRLELTSPPRPPAPGPDEVTALPFAKGMSPTFTQHFDYRWTAEHLPLGGGERGHVQGWIRPKLASRAVDTPAILSLIDAWPPPLLTVLPPPLPLSTVTWQVNLLADLPPEGVAPEKFWFFDSEMIAAHAGTTDTDGKLWAPDGQLVATSRQMVVEFSGR